MSQVDHRNSSATKRARTDGGRREDDWTCSSCGNVNFSFRTTCNMRNCTQPRPTDHSSKFAVKPVQAHQGYLSVAAPHVSPRAHSSMYMGGVPPYGPSVFNGTSMPPYEIPFSGGSAYNYNYGGRFSPGSPYRPLHLSGPPPFSDGSIMRAGGMYGLPPVIDQYRLGFPMSPTIRQRPVIFPEENAQKASDGTRDNDWACPKCGNLNFSFRTACNMRKCNTPKPGPPQRGGKPGKNSPKPETPEGSWKCEKCNNINYPFRTKCNKQNCGADKPSESKKSHPAAKDANDQ